MQLRFGIDIDGARPLSVGKYNLKYSAANLQASFKEEATEVGAHILNKIARPTTHVEALGFQNDIQTNQNFQAKGIVPIFNNCIFYKNQMLILIFIC